MKRIWMFIIALLLVSSACNWQPTFPGLSQPTLPELPQLSTPSPLPALQSTAIAATAPSAPRPTRSPTPTRVPIPTATPSFTPTEVLPTPPKGKVILIEYFDEYGGGDPWQPVDALIGRHLPRLVIYTDGQTIWRDDEGALWETDTHEDVACTLLDGLGKLGFFKAKGDGSLEGEDPIYEKIPANRLGDTGSSSFVLVINGNPSKRVLIYRPFVDYLVRPVKSAWELFNSYRPADLDEYEPGLYVLYFEEGQKLARTYGAGEDLEPEEWPDDLPKPDNLLGDQKSAQVTLDEDEASLLLDFYDVLPGVKLFKRGNERYSAILRPLLPHEDPGNLSPVPQAAQMFALPLECEE